MNLGILRLFLLPAISVAFGLGGCAHYADWPKTEKFEALVPEFQVNYEAGKTDVWVSAVFSSQELGRTQLGSGVVILVNNVPLRGKKTYANRLLGRIQTGFTYEGVVPLHGMSITFVVAENGRDLLRHTVRLPVFSIAFPSEIGKESDLVLAYKSRRSENYRFLAAVTSEAGEFFLRGKAASDGTVVISQDQLSRLPEGKASIAISMSFWDTIGDGTGKGRLIGVSTGTPHEVFIVK